MNIPSVAKATLMNANENQQSIAAKFQIKSMGSYLRLSFETPANPDAANIVKMIDKAKMKAYITMLMVSIVC